MSHENWWHKVYMDVELPEYPWLDQLQQYLNWLRVFDWERYDKIYQELAEDDGSEITPTAYMENDELRMWECWLKHRGIRSDYDSHDAEYLKEISAMASEYQRRVDDIRYLLMQIEIPGTEIKSASLRQVNGWSTIMIRLEDARPYWRMLQKAGWHYDKKHKAYCHTVG